jgi:hypothetical protein
MQPDAGSLGFRDPADFARVRERFLESGFTPAGVQDALGVDVRDPPQFSGPLLERTRGGGPLDVLVRLFLIGVPVDADAVERAVAPVAAERWADAGLLERRGPAVAACVRIQPFDEFWLSHDTPPGPGNPTRPDLVMGVGRSSLTLANLTVRRRAQAALDLGTGCGIHALLASRHCERVDATDRSPRACGFAAFNARLGGLENVACREGDLFEPVRGQRFDLVVSNPPFVLTPAARYLYRDSGLRGDALCRRIVREVPARLREGGYCQLICHWAPLRGQAAEERLASWFEGIGCDAWVLCNETRDTSTYADKWIRHTEPDRPGDWGRLYSEWMADYVSQGIEAVSAGVITLRRRQGKAHWVRIEPGPPRMLGACGESVVDGFALRDFLETVQDDPGLLEARLRVSPHVRLEQRSAPHAGGWRVGETRVELARGLAWAGEADEHLARLLSRADGERPLAVLLEEVATAVGRTPQEVVPGLLPLVRRLVAQGFLLPAGPPC